MAWITNGTPETLSAPADVLQITDLTALKFNVFLYHNATSGNTSTSLRFNNNSNSVYAHRSASNGNPDLTQINQTIIDEPLSFAGDKFAVNYVISISAFEKLGFEWITLGNAVGAANTPFRLEMVYKFVPAPDADITRIDYINDQAGDYGVGSNLSALGTN